MSVNELLKNIKLSLEKVNLSEIEKKRLTKDLEAVYSRLIKREYEKIGFSMNKFDVPNRTQEIFTELEFYTILGKTWQQILKTLPLNKTSRIADICPGFAPKIELGLYYLDFEGSIDLLDIDPNSFRKLIKFMDLFNPCFNMRGIKVDLFKKNNLKYDFIFGNHIIDDFVMYYFAKKIYLSLDKIYENESDYKKLWEFVLLEKEKNSAEITEKIYQIIDSITQKNSTICIAQYKSYMEKITDSSDTYNFNMQVFKNLENMLLSEGYSSLPKIKIKNAHFDEKNYFLIKKNEN